jgi:hypothetical protein
MSINSISHTNIDKTRDNLSQHLSNSTFDQISMQDCRVAALQDSINVTGSSNSVMHAHNELSLLDNQSNVHNFLQAKVNLNSIITYMQNNGAEILDTLRAPSVSAVVNLIRNT